MSKQTYSPFSPQNELYSVCSDVAQEYATGATVESLIEKYNLRTPFNLYRALATVGAKYRGTNTSIRDSVKGSHGGNDNANGNNFTLMKTRRHHRHTYSVEDDRFLVQQFYRAIGASKGSEVSRNKLKKWFPAKTNMSAVICRLRRLGYPLSTAPELFSEMSQGKIKVSAPLIPGPCGWRYMHQENKGVSERAYRIGQANTYYFGPKGRRKMSPPEPVITSSDISAHGHEKIQDILTPENLKITLQVMSVLGWNRS